jgi:hypothetical protein
MCAAVVAGCSTTVPGVAVKPPASPGDAVVALMDTGSYPTRAGPPAGTAGSAGGTAEAHRMAEYVFGPWQIDAALVGLDYFVTVPLNKDEAASTAVAYPMPLNDPWYEQLRGIARAHGFIAGFMTGRVGEGEVHRFHNAVLRFPDPGSAAAAASEMAAVTPSPRLKPYSWTFPNFTVADESLDSWRPDACPEEFSAIAEPNFSATASGSGGVVVRSFIAHGSYVLYQFVVAISPFAACDSSWRALQNQTPLIDQFVPTDPPKIADLPVDPTGQLRARTLEPSSDLRPYSGGVWQPNAWLPFEDNPVSAAKLFNDAGVEWVSRRLTLVYQARDTAGATRVVDQVAADTGSLPEVKATSTGVPGFPAARCFEHTQRIGFRDDRLVNEVAGQRYWQFKCVAQTGRYAFVAFSRQEKDVKQQISAQYRMLAGK